MEINFENLVPSAAVNYCEELRSKYDFRFVLTPNRKTKLGDFRYYPSPKRYIITINKNLNPYLFLITYLHELAHLHVHLEFGGGLKPHGSEWKVAFRNLARPILNESVFPVDLYKTLMSYFRNPKAGFYGHAALASNMQMYNEETDAIDGSKLGALNDGEQFEFNGRTFEKIKLKRSRVLCRETKTQLNYLIHQLAFVKPKRD